MLDKLKWRYHMNYIDLNNLHKREILRHIDSFGQEDFKWEDNNLDNIILGVFEREVEYSNYSSQTKNVVSEINKLIYAYNDRKIRKSNFIDGIKNAISKDSYYSQTHSADYYVNYIEMHKSMYIIGLGGMGKSHYVKYAETLLSNRNIAHLCLYGKYLTDLSVIDWDEIIKCSNSAEFVLIIDAYNELSVDNQIFLLIKLKEYLKTDYGRLYITYKTNSISPESYKKLCELVSNKYEFLGVSYEDTLENLIQNYGLDIFKFEDIAYSNNALCLKMLVNTIGKLSEDGKLYGVSSATYLIENYIKNSLSKDAWIKTKRLSEMLYIKQSTYFAKEDITDIIKNADDYISEMIQYGFISQSYGNNYTFANETIINYLMARYLMRDIKKNTPQQNIELLNKWEYYYSMHDAICVAIFDLYRKNIEKALYLIKNTFLYNEFSLKSIRTVKFSDDEIDKLKSCVELNCSVSECFMDFAGYETVPFNCSNYSSEILIKEPELVNQLSKDYADYFLVGDLRHRLKNILNLIKHINNNSSRTDEYFLTAIWAAALTDKEIRSLASKIIFELIQKFNHYAEKACEIYEYIKDDFIKEAITLALSYQDKSFDEILAPFFTKIISDSNEINAHILAYASNYLKQNLGYIDYDRRNISREFLKTPINKAVYHYIDTADMHSQYWIGFRTDYQNTGIYFYEKFMKEHKENVKIWNEKIDQKYHCTIEGQCSGDSTIGNEIISRNPTRFNYKEIFNSSALNKLIFLDFDNSR